MLRLGSTPPQLSAEFARSLRATKQEFLTDDGIRQHGAACLFESPPAVAWPTELTADEPRIETFVLPGASSWSADGMMATGPDAQFAQAWTASAQAMASDVFAAAQAHGIALAGPAYLTVSVTPSTLVEGLAHFDDDMFMPNDGVGLVAICGSHGGPRVATGTVAHPSVSKPTQLVLDDAIIEAFTAGELPHQQAAADQVVLFPQFGQLHAGPPLAAAADADPTVMRHLMVLRCATVPR